MKVWQLASDQHSLPNRYHRAFILLPAVMEGFAIGLKNGKRRKRGVNPEKGRAARLKAAAGFSGDDDSGDEKPRARAISLVSTTSRQEPKTINALEIEKRRSPAAQNGRHSAPKDKVSQIERLVRRRKDAENEIVGQQSREGKDEALFRYDLERCPEEVSKSAYRDTPVEGFGVAMLRSMGWRGDGDEKKSSKGSSNDWRPKLRPSRLGLGARLQTHPGKSNVVQKAKNVTETPHGVQGESHRDSDVLRGTHSEEELSPSPRKRSLPLGKEINNPRRQGGEQRQPDRQPAKKSRFTVNADSK